MNRLCCSCSVWSQPLELHLHHRHRHLHHTHNFMVRFCCLSHQLNSNQWYNPADKSAFSLSAAVSSDQAFPPPNPNCYQNAAAKVISPPSLGPSSPGVCWPPAKSYSSCLSSPTRSCTAINNNVLRNYQVLSKKNGGIRPLITALSINNSPVPTHTLCPPPLHTPLPTLSLPIRSAVSQTLPAPAPHRKEADQREKPTVSQNRKGACAGQHSPTQRCFSSLSPDCSLSPATWTALPPAGHSLHPPLGWAGLH